MKWSNEQKEQLKELCYAGTPNAELARLFEVPVREIHAKRSALGVTIPKCKAGKPGVRTTDEIIAEQNRVLKAKSDALKKAERCDARLKELSQEVSDA